MAPQIIPTIKSATTTTNMDKLPPPHSYLDFVRHFLPLITWPPSLNRQHSHLFLSLLWRSMKKRRGNASPNIHSWPNSTSATLLSASLRFFKSEHRLSKNFE